MDIGKQAQPMSSTGLHCKNPASKVDMWKSLLNPQINENTLEMNNEDITLQGISLLLGTTFYHFKDVYFQLLNTKNELESVRLNWETSEQSRERLKGALKKAQSDCKNCAKMRKDLSAAEDRKKKVERVLSDALKSLNPSDGSRSQANSQTKKAYTMMTQALLGSQDMSLLDDTIVEDSPLAEMWRCTKQKRSFEVTSSPNEVLATPEKQPLPKRSFRPHHRTPSDRNLPVIAVPESLADEESTVPSPVKRSDADNPDRKVLCDVSLNVQTTPKKGVSKPREGSPILGNSLKKTGKGGFSVAGDNSPADVFNGSPLIRKKQTPTQDLPSPSLLNLEQFQEGRACNLKGALAAVKCPGTSDSPQGPSKVVKLETVGHDVTFERRPGGAGLKKMKQQKLSLSAFHRPKQDISTFKEFNGGVRVQPSDLGLENLDEDRQLEWAKQESLLEERRRKEEQEGIASCSSWMAGTADATFFCPAADQGEDIVAATPQRSSKLPGRNSEIDRRADTENVSAAFQPKITSTMVSVESTMDGFAPDFCSTAKNQLQGLCTPNDDLEALADELCHRESPSICPPRHFENSFDRLPRREKTSPNYKYKRDPVRKKCERQKMPGHEDKCCRGFYNENGVDPNKVSKHRDVHGFQTNTPPDTSRKNLFLAHMN